MRATLLRWTGVTVFCAVFSTVYEHFSHGVYSPFMIWLFAFPLFGGVIPTLAIRLALRQNPTAEVPPRFARDAWTLAVATLAIGSCLTGIFEIYGTTSDYVTLYWILGAGLALVAAARLSVTKIRRGPASSEETTGRTRFDRTPPDRTQSVGAHFRG